MTKEPPLGWSGRKFLCELNKYIFRRGVTILFSKEELSFFTSTTCGNSCFMIKESQDDIYAFLDEFPIPPSQEIRLEKQYNSEWIAKNIYCPLLVSSSIVHIIDPFIGRELYNIADVKTNNWGTESHWVYSLAGIFGFLKNIRSLKRGVIIFTQRLGLMKKS